MADIRDMVTGGCVIGLGVGLYLLGGEVRDFARTGIGAGFLPRVAAVLLVMLGGVLLANGWRRPVTAGAEDPAPESTPVWGGWSAVLASAGLMVAYVASLDGLGFIIGSALYVFLQTLILCKNARRRYLCFGLVSVLVPVGAYWLFVRVFEVMIPAGLLG